MKPKWQKNANSKKEPKEHVNLVRMVYKTENSLFMVLNVRLGSAEGW